MKKKVTLTTTQLSIKMACNLTMVHPCTAIICNNFLMNKVSIQLTIEDNAQDRVLSEKKRTVEI